MYLDTIIDNPVGRYHALLMQDSVCGKAVPRWPGGPRANQWGFLNDFRVGGVEQAKLACVLETMVSENPLMGGFLADDLGSRSWFAGFDWASWSAANQQSYRDGAIAIMQIFRQVADRHGLIVVVNGSWSAGSIAQEGGGYPTVTAAGNALADGSLIEHHDQQSDYFLPNACSPQWASASSATHGRPVMFAVSSTDQGRDTYGRSPCISYTVTQSDYNTVPVPWTGFHATNLPSRAR